MSLEVWKKASKQLQDDLAHSPLGEVLWEDVHEDLFHQKVKLALYGLDKMSLTSLNTHVDKIKKVCLREARSLKSLNIGIAYVNVFYGGNNIITPVFRCRKEEHYSEIYFIIDCFGTIFDNWEDYEDRNPWQKCTLIFPKNGKYAINKYDKCILRIRDQTVGGPNETKCGDRTLNARDAYRLLEKDYWLTLDLADSGKCWLQQIAGVLAVRSKWPNEELQTETVCSSIGMLARINLGHHMAKMCPEEIEKRDTLYLKYSLLLLCSFHIDCQVAKEVILQAKQGLSIKGAFPKREENVERTVITITSYKRFYDENPVKPTTKKGFKIKNASQLGEFHR